MATPRTHQAHSRSHSLLLVQKLLNLRDGVSPLSLVLDSLEQSARPVVGEFVTTAKMARSKVILVAFSTVRKPRDIDVFVRARGKPLAALRDEIASHCSPPPGGDGGKHGRASQKCLIIIDTLNPLAARHPYALPAFLAGIVVPPASLVAVYHTDIPLVLSEPSPSPPPSSVSSPPRPRLVIPPPYHDGGGYGPDPLTLLCHLATAVLRVSSLHQAARRRRARDRSLPEPEWGLREGREGVLVGLKMTAATAAGEAAGQHHDHRDSQQQHQQRREQGGRGERTKLPPDEGGVVVEMEMRRRSGRAVVETFVLATKQLPQLPGSLPSPSPAAPSAISLLTDHPAFATRAEDVADGGRVEASLPPPSSSGLMAGGTRDEGQAMETTFSLGLTEKQRRDRDGVVLPYFDAQTDIGGGEGGRILYEMGREDDYDEEEDEL